MSLGVEELKTNASKSKTVSKLGLKRAAEEIEIPTAKKAKAETQPKAEGDMYIPATEVEVGVQPTTEAKKAAQETKSPAAEKAGADTQRGPGVKRAAEDTEIPAAKRAKVSRHEYDILLLLRLLHSWKMPLWRRKAGHHPLLYIRHLLVKKG